MRAQRSVAWYWSTTSRQEPGVNCSREGSDSSAPHRTGVHGTRPGIFCDCTGLRGLGGGIVDLNLRHERIPPRSPNHNAVCERFHGTILQECWRPAFHRRHFTSIRQLQGEADAWLITYHRRRRNHGDYMRGRTPQEVLDNHKNKAA